MVKNKHKRLKKIVFSVFLGISLLLSMAVSCFAVSSGPFNAAIEPYDPTIPVSVRYYAYSSSSSSMAYFGVSDINRFLAPGFDSDYIMDSTVSPIDTNSQLASTMICSAYLSSRDFGNNLLSDSYFYNVTIGTADDPLFGVQGSPVQDPRFYTSEFYSISSVPMVWASLDSDYNAVNGRVRGGNATYEVSYYAYDENGREVILDKFIRVTCESSISINGVFLRAPVFDSTSIPLYSVIDGITYRAGWGASGDVIRVRSCMMRFEATDNYGNYVAGASFGTFGAQGYCYKGSQMGNNPSVILCRDYWRSMYDVNGVAPIESRVPYLDSIFDSVITACDSFLDLEIFPSFQIRMILTIIVSLAVICAFLKIFAGG